MKKITAMMTLGAFLSSHVALATTYDVKCLNHKGKFSSCTVTVDEDSVKLEYKSKKEKDLDVDIPGKKIKSLAAGEYARRRVGESVATAVLLAPVFLFMLFSKKKRDHIGIEYEDESKKSKATLIEVKKKYGMALKTELKALSGKEIQEEEPKK